MKIREYSVIVHEAEEGGYWLEVPALEGCLTQGETMEELMDHAKEAIALYLEALAETGREIPGDEKLTLGKVGVEFDPAVP